MKRWFSLDELKRFGKYMLVRIEANGVHVVISAPLVYFFGKENWLPILILSALGKYAFDFTYQYTWAFKSGEEKDKFFIALTKYLSARAANLIVAIGIFSTLHYLIGLSLVTSGVITVLISWIITFYLYKFALFKDRLNK